MKRQRTISIVLEIILAVTLVMEILLIITSCTRSYWDHDVNIVYAVQHPDGTSDTVTRHFVYTATTKQPLKYTVGWSKNGGNNIWINDENCVTQSCWSSNNDIANVISFQSTPLRQK